MKKLFIFTVILTVFFAGNCVIAPEDPALGETPCTSNCVVSQKKEYAGDGLISRTTNYIYNDAGNLATDYHTDHNTGIYGDTLYTYNGTLLTTIQGNEYASGGTLSDTVVINISYDLQNRISQVDGTLVSDTGGGTMYTYTFQVTYNYSVNVVTSADITDSEMGTFTTLFAYTASGFLQSQSATYPNGSGNLLVEYAYSPDNYITTVTLADNYINPAQNSSHNIATTSTFGYLSPGVVSQVETGGTFSFNQQPAESFTDLAQYSYNEQGYIFRIDYSFTNSFGTANSYDLYEYIEVPVVGYVTPSTGAPARNELNDFSLAIPLAKTNFNSSQIMSQNELLIQKVREKMASKITGEKVR